MTSRLEEGLEPLGGVQVGANQGALRRVIVLCALTSGVHTFLPVRVRSRRRLTRLGGLYA